MKNLLIIILALFITNCFACKLDYTAQTDSTTCLQEMINNNTLVTLNDGTLLITKNIILHSNISIIGHNTVIKFKTSLAEQAVFRGDNINNITISDITIKDDGVFRNVLFQYPYDNNQFAIGFTNLDRGIMILGNSSNIILDKLDIYGVEIGIIIDNKRLDKLNYINKLSISNSNITNIGKFGIALFNCQNVNLKNNIIDNVQGNMFYGIAPVLSDTKFGDGFYLNGIINGNIVNNNINNVIRIGIVLEGRLNNNSDVTNLNDNVYIANNNINNFYGSRGTEYNAGIWVEPATDATHLNQYKTNSVVIDNNTIDAGLKPRGSHAKWAIVLGAMNAYIMHNIIKGGDIGIECYFGNITFNKNYLENNLKDINLEKQYYLNPIFN